MHQRKFQKFMEGEGFEDEWKAQWDLLKADTPQEQTDYLGPKKSPMRLPVLVEDYILREHSSGQRNESEAGTTKKKPKQKDFEMIDSKVHGELIGWQDDHFAIGDLKGCLL